MVKEQLTVREATPEEVLRWDELAKQFDNYRVMHSLAWTKSLAAAGRGKALFLIYEKQGAIVGCLPGLLVSFGPLLRVFGSPPPGAQTISMGPVFDPGKTAADELLEVVRRDRKWNEDGARQQLVTFFEAWGPTDPLTIETRRRLSSLLFA